MIKMRPPLKLLSQKAWPIAGLIKSLWDKLGKFTWMKKE